MSRTLTLGDLLDAVRRRGFDPDAVRISVDEVLVDADSYEYEITHMVGGPVIDFYTDDEGYFDGLEEDDGELLDELGSASDELAEATSGQG